MSRTTKAPLVKKISDFIRRYVIISDDQLLVLSHYVLHTHQFSERCAKPYATPYIYVNSAQRGSGKTVLGIEIMGVLCRNFQSANNVTTATMFRLAEQQCTLGVDEVDMLFSGGKANDDLVGVINTGYRRGGYVPRYDAKAEGQVRHFHTFSPKIFVGIDNGQMKDTTRSRCIPINIQKATEEERATIHRFKAGKVNDEIEALVSEVYDWSFANTVGMNDYEVEIPELPDPRQEEVAEPLLQVARVTGYEAELRAAIIRILTESGVNDNTPEVDLLMTIQGLFTTTETDKLATADILAAIDSDPRFKGWNGKHLGSKLAPFGVRPTTIRVNGVPTKGYKLTDFADTFSRYLS